MISACGDAATACLVLPGPGNASEAIDRDDVPVAPNDADRCAGHVATAKQRLEADDSFSTNRSDLG